MKYMGSKARLAKYILPLVLRDRTQLQYYVEPFAGGCNSLDKVENPRMANDINRYLIALIENSPKELVGVSKEDYIKIRGNKDSYPDWLVGFAGILSSYCGKWFGGYAGVVRTKDGVRDYQKEAIKNFTKQREKLIGVEWFSGDYYDMIIPENSIIYCDPPYKETTGYGDSFDHERFYDWCRSKRKQGHSVFVSEYQMPDDFVCVWEMQVKSSLSANGVCGKSLNSLEKLYKLA